MMKKVFFLKVFVICLYVFINLFLFTIHSSGQALYYPYGYQQTYNPYWYGYQQSYYPYIYQQQYYYPYSYQQQSYYPYSYQPYYIYNYYPYSYQQQSYYPYSYQQQSYYPYIYQSYYPYSYQQQLYYPYNYSFSSFTNTLCPLGGYAKPAIYLYPQEDNFIDVELNIDGQLTNTIPSYDEGWYVLAKPDGTLFDRRNGYDQDKIYDYLFWEADTDLSKVELELPDQGWIVAKENLEEWFSKNLPLFGLNEKEKAQFMEYWLERLSESAYYELKLLSSEFLAEHASLIITPQPDTLIRVIFFFKPMDEPIALEAPVIETPNREGFVVLEWGGILAE